MDTFQVISLRPVLKERQTLFCELVLELVRRPPAARAAAHHRARARGSVRVGGRAGAPLLGAHKGGRGVRREEEREERERAGAGEARARALSARARATRCARRPQGRAKA